MMSEVHDNTKPAVTGSYSISKSGTVAYFPIEPSSFLKPSIALLLHEKPADEQGNVEITMALDVRLEPIPNE